MPTLRPRVWYQTLKRQGPPNRLHQIGQAFLKGNQVQGRVLLPAMVKLLPWMSLCSPCLLRASDQRRTWTLPPRFPPDRLPDTKRAWRISPTGWRSAWIQPPSLSLGHATPPDLGIWRALLPFSPLWLSSRAPRARNTSANQQFPPTPLRVTDPCHLQRPRVGKATDTCHLQRPRLLGPTRHRA